MGTEVKIMSNYNIAEQKDFDPKEIDPKEVVDWLRRICKVWIWKYIYVTVLRPGPSFKRPVFCFTASDMDGAIWIPKE